MELDLTKRFDFCNACHNYLSKYKVYDNSRIGIYSKIKILQEEKHLGLF